MSCVMIHYNEIGLKGKNQPLFLRRLEANLLRATAGTGVRRVDERSGRMVLSLARDADWSANSRARALRLRCGQLLPGGAHGARHGGSQGGAGPHAGGSRLRVLPGDHAPGVQAVSLELGGDQPRDRRPCGGRNAGPREPRPSRPDHPRRGATPGHLFFVRSGGGSRGPARRRERERGGPAVGRHRLAGGRPSADEAGLSSGLRPFSQLSVPGRHLAGQGGGSGAVPDAVSIPFAALPGARSARCSARSWPGRRVPCGWCCTGGSWPVSRRRSRGARTPRPW